MSTTDRPPVTVGGVPTHTGAVLMVCATAPLYAGFALLALGFVMRAVWETKGRELEEM